MTRSWGYTIQSVGGSPLRYPLSIKEGRGGGRGKRIVGIWEGKRVNPGGGNGNKKD